MTKEQIEQRIIELNQLKTTDEILQQELIVQRDLFQTELNQIQRNIDELNWVNKPENTELQELNIALKVLNT